VSRTVKTDLSVADTYSVHLPLPPSSVMDKDGNTLSPGQISHRIQNEQPRSVIHTSSSSSRTSSSADSCVYVQTNEDDHHSPKTLTPKRGKPAMNGIIVSKSDTDTNRASRRKKNFWAYFFIML
jgi:hypothetical protein